MSEETEVKSTEEVKPQETKSQEKKAPAKKKRPLNAKRKGPAAPKKPAVFSDSLEERFPALAAKLKKQIEDGIKQWQVIADFFDRLWYRRSLNPRYFFILSWRHYLFY